MGILDRIALVVAERHSTKTCVTVSVDSIHFLAPAHLGEILLFHASLNHAWNTSMEVGVKVVAEDFKNGERRHIVSAYLTFVALDDTTHQPTKVPPVIPETTLQKRRYEEAQIRRKNRIAATAERKKRREFNS